MKKYEGKAKSFLAEQDFIAGLSCGQISKKYSVPLGTVQTWLTRYGWAGKRKKFQADLSKEIYQEQFSLIKENTTLALKFAGKVLKVCNKNADEIESSDVTSYERWSRIAQKVSTINRDALPNFSDDMAREIIKALQDG